MPPQLQYAGCSDPERFLSATKKYVSKILLYINKYDKDILMLDQIFPPTNIDRYIRYIPDEYVVKNFIVDRDPRDLYILCKYVENTGVIPCDTPEDFCNWFLWTRQQSHRQNASSNFMRIRFEDLIYRYEETRKSIIEYCSFTNKDCSKKQQIFKPQLSINNTQVWFRFPQSASEIEYISKRLKDYCYEYEAFTLKPDFINGKVFEC